MFHKYYSMNMVCKGLPSSTVTASLVPRHLQSLGRPIAKLHTKMQGSGFVHNAYLTILNHESQKNKVEGFALMQVMFVGNNHKNEHINTGYIIYQRNRHQQRNLFCGEVRTGLEFAHHQYQQQWIMMVMMMMAMIITINIMLLTLIEVNSIDDGHESIATMPPTQRGSPGTIQGTRVFDHGLHGNPVGEVLIDVDAKELSVARPHGATELWRSAGVIRLTCLDIF